MTTNLIRKRTILLCVFFIAACSNPEQNETANIQPEQQFQEETASTQNSPLLSLNELLNASDVKNALAKAAAEKDLQTIKQWQTILLEAADEVDLLEQERMLLEGEQGLVFLEFQGMKTNYQRAFETAFFEFEDLDKVYKAYPAFKDLQEKSKKLVIERDQLVMTVAKELESQGYEGDTLAEARRQWKNFVVSQEQTNLPTETSSKP